MRRVHIWRSFYLCLALAAFLPCTASNAALTNNVGNGNSFLGTMSTTLGASIPAADVQQWITQYTPKATTLVALTECFGGNAITAFTGDSTSVISATSAFQQAVYGGFDQGAAVALAPGADNNGQTVFIAAQKVAKTGETPITGGGNMPVNVSLAPTAAGTAITARQIVVYAGSPDAPAGTTTSDASLFGTIQTNWNVDAGTTVTAVGGAPANPPVINANNPWTINGSAAGFQSAIKSSGTTVNNDSGQLDVYITDHGGLRNVAAGLNRSAGANATPSNVLTFVTIPGLDGTKPLNPQIIAAAAPLASNFVTFTTMDLAGGTLVNPNSGTPPGSRLNQTDNVPCFSILIPQSNIDPANLMNPTQDPLNGALNLPTDNPVNPLNLPTNLVDAKIFSNNPTLAGWYLVLTNTTPGGPNNGKQFVLPDSFQSVYNPTSDTGAYVAAADADVDAGIRVCFQVPLGMNFASVFMDQTYNVSLANNTGNAYDVAEFAQDNPSVANGVPEPGSMLILAVGAAALGGRRIGRRA